MSEKKFKLFVFTQFSGKAKLKLNCKNTKTTIIQTKKKKYLIWCQHSHINTGPKQSHTTTESEWAKIEIQVIKDKFYITWLESYSRKAHLLKISLLPPSQNA